MRWIEVGTTTGKKIPKWARSAGLSDDGIVFVPGAIAGDEMQVMLCAGYDGTPMVQYLNHSFFPAQWLANEFPKCRELCAKIEANTKEYFLHQDSSK